MMFSSGLAIFLASLTAVSCQLDGMFPSTFNSVLNRFIGGNFGGEGNGYRPNGYDRYQESPYYDDNYSSKYYNRPSWMHDPYSRPFSSNYFRSAPVETEDLAGSAKQAEEVKPQQYQNYYDYFRSAPVVTQDSAGSAKQAEEIKPQQYQNYYDYFRSAPVVTQDSTVIPKQAEGIKPQQYQNFYDYFRSAPVVTQDSTVIPKQAEGIKPQQYQNYYDYFRSAPVVTQDSHVIAKQAEDVKPQQYQNYYNYFRSAPVETQDVAVIPKQAEVIKPQHYQNYYRQYNPGTYESISYPTYTFEQNDDGPLQSSVDYVQPKFYADYPYTLDNGQVMYITADDAISDLDGQVMGKSPAAGDEIVGAKHLPPVHLKHDAYNSHKYDTIFYRNGYVRPLPHGGLIHSNYYNSHINGLNKFGHHTIIPHH